MRLPVKRLAKQLRRAMPMRNVSRGFRPVSPLSRITGCIVAVVVAPIAIICLFGLIAFILWMNFSHVDNRRAAKSDEAMLRAIEIIQREARTLNRLPYEDEGNSRLRGNSCRDGWGNMLTYEAQDEKTFIIRSTGKDGRRNTEDDLVEQRTIRLGELEQSQ